MTRRHLLVACLVGAAGLGWMDPTRDRLVAAHRLYDQGKYAEAQTRYGEALIDNPDSAMLNLNMGAASYKAGKLNDALASFDRVQADAKDPARVARAAYNAGNTRYRIGAAAEATAPQDALKAYGAALADYRRALAIDPSDRDGKFNYEFVAKKLDELQQKLAAQQKQQPEDQQQQQQQQQNQEQQQQQQNQEQQEQQEEQQQPEQQEQQAQPQPEQSPGQQQEAPTPGEAEQPEETPGSSEQAGEEAQQQPAAEQGTPPAPQESPGAPAAGGEAAESADKAPDQMSPSEAAALVDSAKQDELDPGEFARQAQGAAVAEPAQDW